MPRIIQAINFFNGIDRTVVCEPDSNKLDWKLAKEILVNWTIPQMIQFKVLGPKPEIFRSYNTVNYCERLIEGIVAEEVESQYHTGFGKLFKWLQSAVNLRK